MSKFDDNTRKLVVLRLEAIPSNVSFSMGSHGSFSKEELIKQVEKGTAIGDVMVEMQLAIIRKMPKIAALMTEYG